MESSSPGFSSILLAMYERNTHTTTRRFDRNANRGVTRTLKHGASPFISKLIVTILNLRSIFMRSKIGKQGKTGPIRATRFCDKTCWSVWWRPLPSCSPAHGTSIALSFKVLLLIMRKLGPKKSRSMLVLELWRVVYWTVLVDLPDATNCSQSKTHQPVSIEFSPSYLMTSNGSANAEPTEST